MGDKTRLALTLLAAALAIGLLGDLLLRATPWGLNFGLWVALLAAAPAVIARWRRIPLAGGGRWLLLIAVGFALAFAWRDSPSLGVANTIALLVCLALAAARSRAGRIAIAGLSEYALAGFWFAMSAQFGFLGLLISDTRWAELPGKHWARRALPVLRGLVLAAPPALLFGALLASADAVFADLAANLFRWDIADAVQHLFWVGLWAWVSGGIVRMAMQSDSAGGISVDRPAAMSLGVVETATVLGTLDAIFLAFVLVQFRYLFGGAALVEASVHLTYAEYARRGFFELVAVVALALPFLLAADWMLRREKPADDRLFKMLAGALVAMLFVVTASALQRMRLYQEEFGLTELRLYTTAFMGWLTVVLAWFLATVLRGRRERFAFGALVAGLLLVAALDVLNPDAFIVSTNIQRAQEGKRFDPAYNMSALSADAVPEILRGLPNLPEESRAEATLVIQCWSEPASSDLRTWNWGRARAWQAAHEE